MSDTVPDASTQTVGEQIKAATRSAVGVAIIWKLFAFRTLLYMIGSDCTFWLASMQGTDWSQLTKHEQHGEWIGLLSMNVGILVAVTDKVMTSLEKGKILPPNDDNSGGTQFIQRTATQTQSVQVTQTPKVP